MTPPDGAPAYASAAHAARLIGKNERTVQLWMEEAGHKDARIAGAGYPVVLLCEVVNRHRWPHKFTVTPEHFNSDVGQTEIADETEPRHPNENPAALALLSEFRTMAGELAALRTQMAQLLADIEQLRDRDEKAAQSIEDGLVRHDAALERIERAVRRKSWWERILGR